MKKKTIKKLKIGDSLWWIPISIQQPRSVEYMGNYDNNGQLLIKIKYLMGIINEITYHGYDSVPIGRLFTSETAYNKHMKKRERKSKGE